MYRMAGYRYWIQPNEGQKHHNFPRRSRRAMRWYPAVCHILILENLIDIYWKNNAVHTEFPLLCTYFSLFGFELMVIGWYIFYIFRKNLPTIFENRKWVYNIYSVFNFFGKCSRVENDYFDGNYLHSFL